MVVQVKKNKVIINGKKKVEFKQGSGMGSHEISAVCEAFSIHGDNFREVRNYFHENHPKLFTRVNKKLQVAGV